MYCLTIKNEDVYELSGHPSYMPNKNLMKGLEKEISQ
jgi:hypothetical protein